MNMKGMMAVSLAMVVFSGLTAGGQETEESMKLVEVRKIWDQAPHNAFTGLIRFHDRWFCVFREGKGHISPDGALRVITSADGAKWESAALITSTNSDLRDPKITVTPDGQLMLSGAECWYDTSKKERFQSLVWFSKDGRTWSDKYKIGEPDIWIWRITWHKGKAYGIGSGSWTFRLYSSNDGKKYDTLIERLFDIGYPNETSIVFDGDTAYCLLRRDPGGALFGVSQPPYTQWEWKEMGARIGGPHMILLPDGRLVAAVRLYLGVGHSMDRTCLCWVDPKSGKLTEALRLPSGGDTSYAGLVLHEGLLWVSYYSSHEGKTSIYLAKVKIDKSQVRPATRYVRTNSPRPDGQYLTWETAATNIQDAIEVANNGDMVLVTNGTYYSHGPVLLGGENGIFNSAMIVMMKGITLQSVNGPAATIIDGNFPACTNRVLMMTHPNALVAGFTITNGNAGADPCVYLVNAGGGVFLSGGGTLSNCVITGNMKDRGKDDTRKVPESCAGVYVGDDGYSTVINCLICGNTTTNAGISAVSFDGGDGQLLNCVISNNWVTHGGEFVAAIGGKGRAVLSNCTIIGNHSGGILLLNDASMVDTCRIVGNTNTYSNGKIGGIGVCVYGGGGAVVKNSWILNNYAGYGAGGVIIAGGGSVLSNCVVSGNSAGPSGGGGVYTGDGVLIANCVITSNSANKDGGGVYLFGTAALRNCLISSNNASQGGGVLFLPYYANKSTGLVDNCTIVQNYASSKGGGIYCGAGQGGWCAGAINNTIIYSNTCADSPNWYIDASATGVGFTNCCTTPTTNLPGSGNKL